MGTPKTMAVRKLERPQRSLIKPHLVNLSGSGLSLNGIIIERDLERPNFESDAAPPHSPKHVIVLHSGTPASLEWRLEGREKAALFSDGEAIVNPAGLFAAPRWSAEVELLLLAVHPGFAQRIAEDMGHRGNLELVPHFHFRDELLKQLACNLIAEFEQASPPDRIYSESLAHTLVAHLVRKYSVSRIGRHEGKHGLPQRRLARVIDYIEAHLGEDLSLKHIAEVAELSPSHFLTLFKRSTGLAPHRYVMMHRLEKAKVLLRQTKMPIADIAGQTGFADQSHLTRSMRRHIGLTPKVLRANE